MARGHSDRFRRTLAASVQRRTEAPTELHGDKALIYDGELEIMARFVADYPGIETGGDLFGFWTHTGSPMIEYVLGPGDHADHNDTAFYQESPFLKSAGGILRDLHGLQHVGTWHSHHRLGLTEPSRGDSNTMQRALDKNGFNAWLLTICNFADKSDGVEMRAYLYHAHGGGERQQSTWLILPGASPVRAAIEAVQEFPRSEPLTAASTYEAIPSTTFAVVATTRQTDSPNFPSFSFMATPEGRSELYRLFQELSALEHDVEILQREDGRVSLSFHRDGYAFEVVFPHSYPVVKPIIECRPVDVPEGQEESWTTPRTLFIDTDRGEDAVTRVEELVTTFLVNREHMESGTPPAREG
ncbi:MAG: hypothetical protein NTV26_01220 [Caldiserica bacterium]|nr:hypothetical protein [Caldisericota bacterium]